MTTPNPSPGFAPAPVDSTQWNAQAIEANARAMQAAQTYRAQDPSQLGSAFDWLTKPAEWVGSKLHSVYSNVVARPISTALIAGYIGGADAQNNSQAWSNLFDSNIWDRAYKDSAHVSPGQALLFGIENFGASNDELKKALEQPVEYNVKNVVGQPTGQIVNLNPTGYLWDNPDAVAQRFDSGIEKWVSGGLDAGYSWYLDPTAKLGEGATALRNAAYVRPMVTNYQKTFADNLKSFATGGLLGKTPDAVSNVDKNLNSSAFTQLGNLIEKQKGKLGSASDQAGGTFENWVTNQAWAKNSSDTSALAAQLGKAEDRSQINDILGIAMGDESRIQALSDKNKELGAMAAQLQRQKEGLITNFPANPTGDQALIQQKQLGDVSQSLTDIASQRADISDRLAIQSSMSSGMYFNPLISPIASNIGEWGRALQTKGWNGLKSAPMTLAYNNLYVRPLRVLTGVTFDGVRAPGHINVFEDNSYRAVDANMDQAKVWSPQERQLLVSKYLAADPNDKGTLLTAMDRATIGRIAQKYGMTDDQANALFTTITGMKSRAIDGNVYSTARINLADGTSLRADHVDDGGNVIAVHPILGTQLENTHVLTDYEKMDKVLKYNAGAFKKLLNEQELQARADAMGPVTLPQMQSMTADAAKQAAEGIGNKAYKATEFAGNLSDTFNKMWKFSALFRVGYGPRAITDDLLGQTARLGAWNMFVDRLGKGGRNAFFRNFALTFTDPTGYEQQVASLESGISSKVDQIQSLNDRIDRINSYIPSAKTGRAARAQNLSRQQSLADTQSRLSDAQDQLNQLRIQRNKIGALRDKLGDQYVITPDGMAFPRPFEGQRGQMFRDMNSDRKTIDSIMGGTAADTWDQMRNGGDWSVLEPATANAQQHITAWNRVVSRQIVNDPAAMQIVKGGTAKDLERWYNTPDGNNYFNALGLKTMGKDDLADRVEATVNQMLPTNTPEGMALRQAIMDGADEGKISELMNSVPLSSRPPVQAEGVAYGMGKSDVLRQMDSIMSKWYDKVAGVPTDVLSRNPLFFSLYRQHVNDLWLAAKDQGLSALSTERQGQMVEQARKLALKDVKRFTYNMDFESKLAYKMRFIAPFWGPMQEGFTRWGRMVADKPDIVAHAADLFTSPIRNGHAVDKNGNPVDENGYAIDPQSGQKYLVPKGDMHLRFQLPSWAAKGLLQEGFPTVDMPINTLNIVLQNDPWFNPGMGPWVQVPANYLAMNSNPTIGDTMQKLGILSSVKQSAMDQAGVGGISKLLSTVINGPDPQQQQQDMLQIMQAEDYRYKTGLRSTEPTWQEVKDRASQHGYLKALLKAVLPLPVSPNFTDPYQFFRDRYQELQQANSKTADQIFLQKYGAAAFDFTAAMSKSSKSLPSTAEAVMADERFKSITDEFPELAGLIVGPYGKGDFSNTAYQQQLASGDRSKITAQDSIKQANANLGWTMFSKYMNIISSGLYQAGFTSFQDPGAKTWNDQRKALVQVLGSSKLPNGQANPFYNADWFQAYSTVDKSKQQRTADALQKIATTAELVNDPMRKDIQGLQQYMVLRNTLTSILAERKKAGGTDDVNSIKNFDLRQNFAQAVQSLDEQNTMFQSLHYQYLSNDMFNHYDPALGITQ